MPVSIVEEDGTGLANANTYVDPAGDYATGYAAAWLYGAEWNDATADTKKQAVVMATRTLDAQFEFVGTPANAGQALAWPRETTNLANGAEIPDDEVPSAVKAATMEMALALLQRNRTSDTDSGSRGVKAINLGNSALKIDFGEDPTTAPVKSVIPANVRAILREYGDAAGGGMVRVQRR